MDIDYSLALSFSKLAVDVFFKSTVLLVGIWLTVKLLRRHSASVLSLLEILACITLVLYWFNPKVVAETGPAGSAVISEKLDHSEIGGQIRITEMMEMLDADCCEDRLTAVKALSTKTDNPKVIAALQKALKDEDAQVRQAAEEFFAGKQVGD